MPRTLMVVRASKGGEFVNVTRLATELQRRGHDVAICGPHDQHRGDLDVELLELDLVRPLTVAGDSRAVVSLSRIIHGWKPDLIHAHGSKGGAVARLARLTAPRTPLVFTPHQYAFANYFSTRGEIRTYRGMERALAPLASRVICVCEAERRLAAEIGRPDRTRLVYNGIDPPALGAADPATQRLREAGPLICAVSELHVRKGVVSLIEAMPAVLEAAPEANLVIVGDGPERESLEATIAAMDLADKVHPRGHVDDVTSVLQAADVFVNPAWAEAFPYSVLEAMAIGLPIVATDVGGVGEAVEDGVSGVLAPPRDPAALASAISAMLADRTGADAMAQAAQSRQRQLFSAERMVEGTFAVYSELTPL